MGPCLWAEWLLIAKRPGILRATFDFLARFQILEGDSLLTFLALIFFHVVSPGWSVGGCELSLAPNNNPLPPVILFLGIRSFNRMPEVLF